MEGSSSTNRCPSLRCYLIKNCRWQTYNDGRNKNFRPFFCHQGGSISARSDDLVARRQCLLWHHPSAGVVVISAYTLLLVLNLRRFVADIVDSSDVPLCVRLSCACLEFVVVRVQTTPCFVLLCWLFRSHFHFPNALCIVKPRLHDTTCCQIGRETGLTTACIVYINIQPVVCLHDVAGCPTGLTSGCIVQTGF